MEFWLGILIEIVFYFSIVSIYFFPQMKKTFWKKLAVDSVQRNWLPSWDHPELVNQHYWTFCLVTSKSIVFVLCTHITKGQLSPQKFSIYDAINQTLKQNIYNFRSTLESIQENSEEEEKKHYDSVVGTCISCCVWIIYLLPWQAKTTIHTRFHRLFFLFISVKTKDLARSFKTFLFFFLLKTKYGFSTYALWTTAEEKKNNNVTLFFQASERSANRTIYERSLQIKIIPRFCIYELRFQHFSVFFLLFNSSISTDMKLIYDVFEWRVITLNSKLRVRHFSCWMFQQHWNGKNGSAKKKQRKQQQQLQQKPKYSAKNHGFYCNRKSLFSNGIESWIFSQFQCKRKKQNSDAFIGLLLNKKLDFI